VINRLCTIDCCLIFRRIISAKSHRYIPADETIVVSIGWLAHTSWWNHLFLNLKLCCVSRCVLYRWLNVRKKTRCKALTWIPNENLLVAHIYSIYSPVLSGSQFFIAPMTIAITKSACKSPGATNLWYIRATIFANCLEMHAWRFYQI
jgi:hypothetical protein